ncbi:MAG TPA: rhodanese-like domain-containing protein [Campylobacterales bacterium]|nr:rhodanese-like domain-containing protein [Campylobacterales bacterium]
MKKYLFLVCLLLSPKSFANSEQGCSISALLITSESTVFESLEDINCTEEKSEDIKTKVIKTGITEQLMSVKVMHETKEILIEREVLNNKKICPPFCIEPMSIENVLTVGELEVLSFIDKLKEKKARLLIDVRESTSYSQGSIPGSINLPFSMLNIKSKYHEEVLTLLGAKAIKKNSTLRWSFKEVQSLLIFGSSATSNEASNTIKELLKLGYPSSKLFYYRSGITSWKALGLSIR